METRYRKQAIKALAAMQPKQARTMVATIDRIAADPGFKSNNLKPLRGVANGYRYRLGDWRISFVLDREAGSLEVFEIAPRGGAYR